jgi:hypothetical protein
MKFVVSDGLDMYILSPTRLASDMTSTVRPPLHVHTFTYMLSVWYDLNRPTSWTCTYFHLHPQLLIWPQLSDLLDMYILSPTPLAFDMTSTVRQLDMYILSHKPSASDVTSTVKTPRHVHTFTYNLSVRYDLNSQTSSTCTYEYFHINPQRPIWPQQSHLLSHTRRQHLAEIYPSNDTDINEIWTIKYSVADRGIRHTGAHSPYIRYKHRSFIQMSWWFSFIAMD